MTKFLSAFDLRSRAIKFDDGDVQLPLPERKGWIYTDSVHNWYDWMTLGETEARKTDNFDEMDFLALRQQDYVVVTTDGWLFKIKIRYELEYGVDGYDEFKALIKQYREQHGMRPSISINLVKEFKCKARITSSKVEEMRKENGYWMNKQELKEILKNAYEKGVISIDTMLDRIGMFD